MRWRLNELGIWIYTYIISISTGNNTSYSLWKTAAFQSSIDLLWNWEGETTMHYIESDIILLSYLYMPWNPSLLKRGYKFGRYERNSSLGCQIYNWIFQVKGKPVRLFPIRKCYQLCSRIKWSIRLYLGCLFSSEYGQNYVDTQTWSLSISFQNFTLLGRIFSRFRNLAGAICFNLATWGLVRLATDVG